MKTWTNPENGVTIRVGQCVRAYHKGIFLITKIEERKGYAPLAHYKKVASADCKPEKLSSIAKAVERDCDASYCKPVTVEELFTELILIKKNYEDTINLIKQLSP
jgi:hypothetical protein